MSLSRTVWTPPGANFGCTSHLLENLLAGKLWHQLGIACKKKFLKKNNGGKCKSPPRGRGTKPRGVVAGRENTGQAQAKCAHCRRKRRAVYFKAPPTSYGIFEGNQYKSRRGSNSKDTVLLPKVAVHSCAAVWGGFGCLTHAINMLDPLNGQLSPTHPRQWWADFFSKRSILASLLCVLH